MNNSENIKVKRNLTALVEFSRIINSSLDLDFILNNVLLTCMGKFLSTKGLIAICKEGKLILKSSKGISEEQKRNFPQLTVQNDFENNIDLQKFINDYKFQAVEKISSSDECLGIVCLGEKLNKLPFTEDDIEFLKTILNISASAIQNSLTVNEIKIVNRTLDSRVQRLNSLFELSKEFGLFSESSRVVKLLVYSVIGQFLVSKFAVVTFLDGKVQIIDSKFSEDQLLSSLTSTDLSKLDNPLIESDIENKFPELFNIGIELVVPMQIQSQVKGLIILGKRINNQKYSEADIEFIYSIGSLAIISLENRRLFKEALEKQKMEEELEIARGIQTNLLPGKIPEFSNFDIAVFNLTSQQVGGDYYDIISLNDNSFCIAIGDVSGKGVPAALLMANLQAFLKTICRQEMEIVEATALINDLVTENTSDGKFITFFWALFENEKRKIRYVNAGHNPPLLIRNGKIQKLEKGGIIFGVMKTISPYLSEEIVLQKDDIIILFTDGITEAKNVNDDDFGDERLESIAENLEGLTAQEIMNKIKEEVQMFAHGAMQSDDMTLLVIRVR